MEDDQKKIKKNGCDTIVNSPSLSLKVETKQDLYPHRPIKSQTLTGC